MDQVSVSLRHKEILKKINAVGYVTIDELAKTFNKTTQTIRADVTLLAESGKIRRHHGGVSPITNREQMPYNSRQVMNYKAKEKIARKAAKLIDDGAGLYLGIGTTAEAVAQELRSHKSLRIVSNNINIPRIFADCDDSQIFIAGGEVRKTDLAVMGQTAIEFVNHFRMEYAVIGTSGIDSNGDLLDYDFREANILRSVISTAKNTILVADTTKFSLFPITRVANLKDITHFVTDKKPPKTIEDICSQHDINLIVCS